MPVKGFLDGIRDGCLRLVDHHASGRFTTATTTFNQFCELKAVQHGPQFGIRAIDRLASSDNVRADVSCPSTIDCFAVSPARSRFCPRMGRREKDSEPEISGSSSARRVIAPSTNKRQHTHIQRQTLEQRGDLLPAIEPERFEFFAEAVDQQHGGLVSKQLS